MSPEFRFAAGTAVWLSLLVVGTGGLAQTSRVWVDPPGDLVSQSKPEETPSTRGTLQTAPEEAHTGQDDPGSTATARPSRVGASTAPEHPPAVQSSLQVASAIPRLGDRAVAARNLAFRYLDRWSAPNQIALTSAPSFYGSTVLFHGRPRSFASVLAEKRRFAERWPDRNYRYRTETTQVACETAVAQCTVWSLFDFFAVDHDRERHARGIGEHELVVSFVSEKPIIVSESSRVLYRGATQQR